LIRGAANINHGKADILSLKALFSSKFAHVALDPTNCTVVAAKTPSPQILLAVNLVSCDH